MTELLVRAARVDITPSDPVPLFGYRGRPAAYDRVKDSLEINGVLLCQGDRAILLASADLLYITEECETLAREMLTERYSSSTVEVFFGATHNHFAPAVDPTKPRLGRVDRQYESYVKDRIRNLVDQLCRGEPRPGTVHYGSGKADHAINRRRRGWEVGRQGIKYTMAALPNPDGPKDETVHVISIREADGDPIAGVWSYACHPTALPERNSISSEFPGRVRSEIRHSSGDPDLPVLFYQGFAGNIRPPAYDRRMHPVTLVRRLLNGSSFGGFNSEEYERWSGSLAGKVLDLWQTAAPSVEAELGYSSVTVPLDDVMALPDGKGNILLSCVSLSSDLCLVGLSAEVMTEYVAQVRSCFSNRHAIPVSCVGQTFGYLPTSRMLIEGGYEASGFLPLFELQGEFRDDCETRIIQALEDLSGGRRQG